MAFRSLLVSEGPSRIDAQSPAGVPFSPVYQYFWWTRPSAQENAEARGGPRSSPVYQTL